MEVNRVAGNRLRFQVAKLEISDKQTASDLTFLEWGSAELQLLVMHFDILGVLQL